MAPNFSLALVPTKTAPPTIARSPIWNIILSHDLPSTLTISLRADTHKSLLLENLDP
ncbi:hypothetical protein [Microseira sp. BLCC-F43]|uniref:hypothetical protein n=1 Tax=Microseira sp. BLCC-F43 TaxID=3153602 RepID=UPI0035BA19A1